MDNKRWIYNKVNNKYKQNNKSILMLIMNIKNNKTNKLCNNRNNNKNKYINNNNYRYINNNNKNYNKKLI